jgi:hypothetical protein
MKPLTQRRKSADKDKRSSFPGSRSPQHVESKSIVVLGVLYPSALPQPGETDTRLALVPPPLGVIEGRQSAGVVFYDPLSTLRNGDEDPHIAKYWRNPRGNAHTDRAAARKAVARDLTLLLEERRQSQPSTPSVSDTKTRSSHPPRRRNRRERFYEATVFRKSPSERERTRR